MERHRDGGVEDSDPPLLRYEPTTDASCKAAEGGSKLVMAGTPS
jgi:hypothetical protein